MHRTKKLLLPAIIVLLSSSLCKFCNGSATKASAAQTTKLRSESINQTAHLQSLPKVAPLLGESAIIDKESGRVFWQGGELGLIHSTVGHTYFKNKTGLARHVRTTIYSCILWISVIRFLAQYIRSNIQYLHSKIQPEKIRAIFKKTASLLRIVLFFFAHLPKFSRKFLIVIGVFYLIESYTCSTRKYLQNASSAVDVESYLEAMKEQKPCIEWDIRCFHYERRKVLCTLVMYDMWKFIFEKSKRKKLDEEEAIGGRENIVPLSPSIFSKKVVTHQTSQCYKFNSWEDETIGGIWKQNEATTSINADFTKISLYKLLMFANAKARSEYFAQQSKFVSKEGQKDMYAELSTKVEVQGYKPKILLLKRKHGVLGKIFSIQCYWLCTCLLLTLPFRIHFARHCDELHITLAKETSAEVKQDTDGLSPTRSRSSWFPYPRSWFSGVPSSTPIERTEGDILQETDVPEALEKEPEDGSIEPQEKVEQEEVAVMHEETIDEIVVKNHSNQSGQ